MDSPLLSRGPAPAITCPRCGRLFEMPIDKPIKVRGHVQGDPDLCIALPGMASVRGSGRDARSRKASRRGS